MCQIRDFTALWVWREFSLHWARAPSPMCNSPTAVTGWQLCMMWGILTCEQSGKRMDLWLRHMTASQETWVLFLPQTSNVTWDKSLGLSFPIRTTPPYCTGLWERNIWHHISLEQPFQRWVSIECCKHVQKDPIDEDLSVKWNMSGPSFRDSFWPLGPACLFKA